MAEMKAVLRIKTQPRRGWDRRRWLPRLARANVFSASVAQIGNPLCRRLLTCSRVPSHACRLPIGETADYQSALRRNGWTLTVTQRRRLPSLPYRKRFQPASPAKRSNLRELAVRDSDCLLTPSPRPAGRGAGFVATRQSPEVWTFCEPLWPSFVGNFVEFFGERRD